MKWRYLCSGGLSHDLLTVDVQDNHFVVRWRQVCVTRHAHEASVQVLPTHIPERQVIDGRPIRTVLKRFIDDSIVQVPGHIRRRTA